MKIPKYKKKLILFCPILLKPLICGGLDECRGVNHTVGHIWKTMPGPGHIKIWLDPHTPNNYFPMNYLHFLGNLIDMYYLIIVLHKFLIKCTQHSEGCQSICVWGINNILGYTNRGQT